jgi:hypothetical protein
MLQRFSLIADPVEDIINHLNGGTKLMKHLGSSVDNVITCIRSITPRY